MRRFTLFTLLYLATGICIMVIALQSPDIASRTKTILLGDAGFLYLTAVLSTFPSWRQGMLQSQNKTDDRPTQKRRAIAPWLLIAVTLSSFIFTVLTKHWTDMQSDKELVG